MSSNTLLREFSRASEHRQSKSRSAAHVHAWVAVPETRPSRAVASLHRLNANPRITVLTVDDHPLLREGIAAVIQRQPDMQLVGEASNGREALASFLRLRPDVTLMDLQMPEMSGIDAIDSIRAETPGARILVLTTYRGDAQAARALRAGAAGYLLKSTLRKELLEAIRAVHAGERWIPQDIANEIADHLNEPHLTHREIDVLRYVARGNSNREVGHRLSISEETVKARMKSILTKLGAGDRTHAVSIALRRGILEL